MNSNASAMSSSKSTRRSGWPVTCRIAISKSVSWCGRGEHERIAPEIGNESSVKMAVAWPWTESGGDGASKGPYRGQVSPRLRHAVNVAPVSSPGHPGTLTGRGSDRPNFYGNPWRSTATTDRATICRQRETWVGGVA